MLTVKLLEERAEVLQNTLDTQTQSLIAQAKSVLQIQADLQETLHELAFAKNAQQLTHVDKIMGMVSKFEEEPDRPVNITQRAMEDEFPTNNEERDYNPRPERRGKGKRPYYREDEED